MAEGADTKAPADETPKTEPKPEVKDQPKGAPEKKKSKSAQKAEMGLAAFRLVHGQAGVWGSMVSQLVHEKQPEKIVTATPSEQTPAVKTESKAGEFGSQKVQAVDAGAKMSDKVEPKNEQKPVVVPPKAEDRKGKGEKKKTH